MATVSKAPKNGTSPAAGRENAFEMLRPVDLQIDERVQRTLIPSYVKRLAADLRVTELGVFTVNRRPDGDLIVLDGQHRRAALIEAGLGEIPVKCDVYRGLSLAEEAAKFRACNTQRQTIALDDFLVGVVEGDEECVAINTLIEAHGFYVSGASAERGVSCVHALRKVYRQKKHGMDGPRALDYALRTIVAAWGHRPEATEGHIIQGISEVFLRYGDQVDGKVLVSKLAKAKGGPAGIIGNARTLRDIQKGSINGNVAQIVVGLYNSGRRTSRLGE